MTIADADPNRLPHHHRRTTDAMRGSQVRLTAKQLGSRVAIIVGGISIASAAMTAAGWLVGVAWREGTRPMVQALQEERRARQTFEAYSMRSIERIERRQLATISALLDENPARGRRMLADEMRKELGR